jgi:hypothetical protein
VAQYEDMFRDAFEAHEHLAPNMGPVYLGSQELYRRYMRRRRSTQAVSCVVIGAGLFAAGTHLPAGLLPGATVPARPAGVSTGTPTAAVPPVPTEVSQTDLDRDLEAFDNAGYGYDDAVRLATIWHTKANIGFVKAEAGSLLLAGQTLPIPPHPDRPASSTPDPREVREQAAREKFWSSGYELPDAEKLSRLWHVSIDDAKTKAGLRLLAGQSVPVRP